MSSVGEAYLQECRALVIDEMGLIVRSATSNDARAYGLMLDYPLRHAKGLRPALCIAVCRALGGELAEVLPSAAVIELFHNAFLIHDDIEDGSLQRRGTPTLHQLHGASVALNVGDGMLALTLSPLLANTDLLGLGRALRILEIVRHMVTITYEGQAEELRWIREGAWDVSDADYEAMVLKKTGWYSFVAPALVGAVVARASSEVEQRLVMFAESLGLAFQIQDDLLNLEGAFEKYGKELGGDLWEGKRTLMLAHVLRHATPEDRDRALRILDRPRAIHDDASILRFRELLDGMERDGIIDAEARLVMERYVRARATPNRVESDDELAFLRALMVSHDSLGHARRVAARHAGAAEASWSTLAEDLPPSVHVEFLGWLKDYVVQRDW